MNRLLLLHIFGNKNHNLYICVCVCVYIYINESSKLICSSVLTEPLFKDKVTVRILVSQ